MLQFTKPTRLFVASALCVVSLLPVVAQAHGRRNDATKVIDAAVLPARKVLHFGKKTSHSAVERVGHVTKQIVR